MSEWLWQLLGFPDGKRQNILFSFKEAGKVCKELKSGWLFFRPWKNNRASLPGSYLQTWEVKKKGDYEQDSVRTGCVWTTSLISGMIWQARAAEVSYLYLSRTCDVVSQVCMQIGEMGTGRADCEAAAGDGLCSVKTKVSSEMAREKLKKRRKRNSVWF